jgi:hypothetical protein
MVLASLLLLLSQKENFLDGPINSHSYTLFSLGTNDFMPDEYLTTSIHQIDFDLRTYWSNGFNSVNDKILDFEIVKHIVTMHTRIDQHWYVDCKIPILYVGGGNLDGFIDNFHTNFGFEGNNRENYDSNQFVVSDIKSDSYYGLGDISFGLHRSLVDILKSTFIKTYFDNVVAGIRIQLPTMTEHCWYDNDGINIGVSLTTIKRCGDFTIFSGVSFVYVGNTEVVKSDLNNVLQTVFSINYKLFDCTSVILQFNATSGNANVDQYSQWVYDVVLGLKFDITNRIKLDISAVENIFHYDNSADITFVLGMIVK